MTEQEMRDTKVPTPEGYDELVEYVSNLVSQPQDYGTCVYAMSMAATAAFNLVAHKLGVTGFQASCADMDILRRTRDINGGFILLKLEDCLYPQYNLRSKLDEFLSSADAQKWLAEEATKKLKKSGGAHPDVLDHWKKLSAYKESN